MAPVISLSEITPKLARRRRLTVWCGNLVLLGCGVVPLFRIIGRQGWSPLGIASLILFSILLAQVVFGFTIAAIGFWQLASRHDWARINNTLPPETEARTLPATAVVIPIFNEDVSMVFQELRVMYASLQATGRADGFDFFVLSDSNDPNSWIAEERAWLEVCKLTGGYGRIFYRKRRLGLNHKSGNIADFCRRWGAKYRYMIVLDADSLMRGPVFVRLVELMERNRRAGIIQTLPQLARGASLFQRVTQFAGRVYGPMFAAGSNYWHLGGGTFWGHNAIIRLEPFMAHCAMPELPASSPLGRRILSHDTIEAALMWRAGFEVWLAYDLEGSYEAGPPDLLAALKRSQRWCFGNLQHLWFLFSPRLPIESRIHILNGIMAYLGSPLWLLFLLLSSMMALNGPSRLGPLRQADPAVLVTGGVLYFYILCLLLGPKVLGAALCLRSPGIRRQFGGAAGLLSSVLLETVLSALQAPILMLFYTRFVWSALTGGKMEWGAQARDADTLPTWRELLSVHGVDACFMLAWAALIAWLKPAFLPWLAPVFIGPIVAAPMARALASKSWGRRARDHNLFVTPEESNAGSELRQADRPFHREGRSSFHSPAHAGDLGLLRAILDPYVNAIHVSLVRYRRQASLNRRENLLRISDRLLSAGPESLTAQEKRILLWDSDSMLRLHWKLWSTPHSELHPWWRDAFRLYADQP